MVSGRGRLLRHSLAVGKLERCRTFNLGDMNDATEAYEMLLGRLHPDMGPDDTCSDRDCWLHTLLGLYLEKTPTCRPCGEGGTSRRFWTYVTYLPASTLFRADLKDFMESRINLLQPFAHTYGESVTCDREMRSGELCQLRAEVKDKVLQLPSVLALGLVWNTASAPLKQLSRVAELLYEKINLKAHPQFASLKDDEAHAQLIGIVCYYKGCHYVSYFLNEEEESPVWVFIDDSLVRNVSHDMQGVTTHIREGMYQPCLLFYRTRAAPPTPKEELAARVTEALLEERALKEEVWRQERAAQYKRPQLLGEPLGAEPLSRTLAREELPAEAVMEEPLEKPRSSKYSPGSRPSEDPLSSHLDSSRSGVRSEVPLSRSAYIPRASDPPVYPSAATVGRDVGDKFSARASRGASHAATLGKRPQEELTREEQRTEDAMLKEAYERSSRSSRSRVAEDPMASYLGSSRWAEAKGAVLTPPPPPAADVSTLSGALASERSQPMSPQDVRRSVPSLTGKLPTATSGPEQVFGGRMFAHGRIGQVQSPRVYQRPQTARPGVSSGAPSMSGVSAGLSSRVPTQQTTYRATDTYNGFQRAPAGLSRTAAPSVVPAVSSPFVPYDGRLSRTYLPEDRGHSMTATDRARMVGLERTCVPKQHWNF
eukprot:TRINITY_DN26728_c0_g1_i1.p1 TRINITY_DN26728_c0_g1~~TRINITY_DN26728_c0_g1_i1.p1  ORF type:complete len:743 (+),score=135.55 TRINITY_DN26728_c0_g1_i1:271-2229(+)